MLAHSVVNGVASKSVRTSSFGFERSIRTSSFGFAAGCEARLCHAEFLSEMLVALLLMHELPCVTQ